MTNHDRIREIIDFLGEADDGNMWDYAQEVRNAYDELVSDLAAHRDTCDTTLDLLRSYSGWWNNPTGGATCPGSQEEPS